MSTPEGPRRWGQLQGPKEAGEQASTLLNKSCAPPHLTPHIWGPIQSAHLLLEVQVQAVCPAAGSCHLPCWA